MNREKLKQLNKKYGNSPFFQQILKEILQNEILKQVQNDRNINKRRILNNG